MLLARALMSSSPPALSAVCAGSPWHSWQIPVAMPLTAIALRYTHCGTWGKAARRDAGLVENGTTREM